MEQKKNFKSLINPNTPFPKGRALPIEESLTDIGLESANAQGEATVKKVIIKPKRVVKPKVIITTLKDYKTYRKRELYPKVFVILSSTSKIEESDLETFEDFINVSESTVDIVDIVPNLYPNHYDIIKHSSTRFMIGDKVTVNFKYRSLNPEKAYKQMLPRQIKDIKFVALEDKTAVIAYLYDNDFYPINELDHYDTN